MASLSVKGFPFFVSNYLKSPPSHSGKTIKILGNYSDFNIITYNV